MIKRIVKLSFQPQFVERFLEVFAYHRERIQVFPGCQHIELMRCKSPDHIFFTFSIWDNEEALETYRQSELFKNTWSKTKVLFSDRPEAWMVLLVKPPLC